MTSIQVKKREAARVDELRISGLVPAVVYGGDREQTTHVSIGKQIFDKLYEEAGESTLIDFQIEGEQEPVKVLIQDVQYDPVKRTVLHIDFRQIRMGEEMTATVELVFVGEAPAVKALGGTLMQNTDSVDIKCLPKDLISHIDVDLSVLKTFDDSIKVSDLSVPETVTITDDPDAPVASVTPPLSEEAFKAMEESGPQSIEDVVVEEKGKKAEDEDAGGVSGGQKEKSEKAEKS